MAEEGSARGRSHGRVNTDSCDPHSYLTGEDSKVQRTKTLVSKIALPLGGHAKAWPRVCLPRSPGSDPTRAHTPHGGQETRSGDAVTVALIADRVGKLAKHLATLRAALSPVGKGER